MSRIDEMIKELCPDGLEKAKLEDVCTTITPPTKLKTNEYLPEGEYLIIDQGQNAYAGFTNNEEALLPLDEYVLYGDHTCSVKYVNEPFAQGADGLKILKAKNVNCKYLYYAICVNNLDNTEYKRHWTQAKDILIPLPPLSVQQGIVSVLDSFTTLIDKMKQEVEKRKKQMEYYREELLTFEEGECEWKSIGDTCNCKTGSKPNIISEKGLYEYINAGTSNSGFIDQFNTEGDTVTTPSRGQRGIGFVGFQKTSFWCGPLCYKIQSKYKTMLNKYVFYYLSTFNELILQFKCEGGTPALNLKDLQSIEIPIPPLERQSSIVSTLDKFESYISKLKRMIELRQKQYEYYREKLLTFE